MANSSKPPLSKKVRILIGIASIPSFVLCCMVLATIYKSGLGSVDTFEVIYSLVGALALYIALSGKRLF